MVHVLNLLPLETIVHSLVLLINYNKGDIITRLLTKEVTNLESPLKCSNLESPLKCSNQVVMHTRICLHH